MRSLSSAERAAADHLLFLGGPAQRVDAAEQRVHARDQVRERQILGEEVVGAEAQAGDRIELAVARRQENDRQLRRQAAQFAAQLEATLGLVFERDVDDREVGQARGEGRHGLAPVRIAAHGITLARERRGVVVADGAFVFDDGDGLFHRGSSRGASLSDRIRAVWARPHFVTFDRRSAIKASRHRPSRGREMASRLETRGPAMNDSKPSPAITPMPLNSSATAGERWRRFLERVGTRSNDFAVRLSRARFVYLHRREVATHWLPL